MAKTIYHLMHLRSKDYRWIHKTRRNEGLHDYALRIQINLGTICGHRCDAASYHAHSEVLLVLRPLSYVGASEDDMGMVL